MNDANTPDENLLLKYLRTNSSAFADERQAWDDARAALLKQFAALKPTPDQAADFDDRVEEAKRNGVELGLAVIQRRMDAFGVQLEDIEARLDCRTSTRRTTLRQSSDTAFSMERERAAFPKEVQRVETAMTLIVCAYMMLEPTPEQLAGFDQCITALINAGTAYGAAIFRPFFTGIANALEGREA